MPINIIYQFSALVWQHSSPSGWYFVSLPTELATEIRELFKKQEEGWGRMKAIAKISEIEWATAIWFDSKLGTYLLPIKAEIRNREMIDVGTELNVEILL
ncbi:MAG: DUF1905 domain-containing protein [Bacteroidota bacterium]